MPNSAMVWAREYTRDQAKREKEGGRRVRPRLQNMHFVDIEHTPRGSAVTKLEVAVADGNSFEPTAVAHETSAAAADAAAIPAVAAAADHDADVVGSGAVGTDDEPTTSAKNMISIDLIGGSVFDAIGMDASSTFASIIWGKEDFLPIVDLPEFDPNMPQAPISLSPPRSLKKGVSNRTSDSGGLIACTTVLEFEVGSSPAALGLPRPTGVTVTTEAGCLGLRVESVITGSAGAAAGIREDDLIMGINGATFDLPTGFVAQEYFDSLVHVSTMVAKKQNCQIHLLRPCGLIKCHIKRGTVNDGFEPLQLTMTTHDDRVVGRTHKCARIKAGGPAAASGVQVNDVIMQIDGSYVAHLAHWQVLKQLGRAGSFWLVIGRANLDGLRDENTRPPDIKAVEGFLCPVCQMNLGTPDALTAHFESAHPAPPPPPLLPPVEPPRFCRFCGDRFEQMDAKQIADHTMMHEKSNEGAGSAVEGSMSTKTNTPITDRDQKRATAAAVAAAAAADSPKTPRSKWNFSLFSRSPKPGRSNGKTAVPRGSSLTQGQNAGGADAAASPANGFGGIEGGEVDTIHSPRSVQRLARAARASASSSADLPGGHVATAIFRHISNEGKRIFYNDADCKLIKTALEYGDAIVRINDVDAGGGERLRFEVRFGPAAKMRGRSGLSPTGIVQVNLDTGATRVVEELSSGPIASSGTADRNNSSARTASSAYEQKQQKLVGPNDVGLPVRVVGYSSTGTLAFYGPHATHGRIRCGVVLDDASGLNNGCVQGHQYFSCPPNRGVLVVPQKVLLLL